MTDDRNQRNPTQIQGEPFSRLHPHLPVFGVSVSNQFAVYIPGHICAVPEEQFHDLARHWSDPTYTASQYTVLLAKQLLKLAQSVEAKWTADQMRPFTPERLTVYLSDQCNAQCIYCYAASPRQRSHASEVHRNLETSPEAILSAGRYVADACVKHNTPFRLTLHGGGEPTLHWETLQWIVHQTKKLTHERGLDWKGHIATNGLVSEDRANWIADHFSSVSLSHDGPPDIHNTQRPRPDGRPTLALVERTLHILQDKAVPLYIRTTLLPAHVQRQQEIVQYLSHQCHATNIHLEPLYQVRDRANKGFQPSDASLFVEHFQEAKAWAGDHNVTLSLSGTRIQELHGPYCNTLRHTLHIIPGDVATACFFTTNKESAMKTHGVIGQWDRTNDTFILDMAKIDAHRRSAYHLPKSCRDCLCAYHCTRGCPTQCCSTGKARDPALLFHCHVSQLLVLHEIRNVLEAARTIPGSHTDQGIIHLVSQDHRR